MVRPDDNLTLKSVKLFKEWPKKSSQKVPSAISYSPTKNGCRQWGFDIDNESDVLQWTKLELEPKNISKELDILKNLMQGLELVQKLHEGSSKGAPKQISKSSEDVVRDYLLYVMEHFYDSMTSGQLSLEGHGANTFKEVPVDVIFTHPSVGFPDCIRHVINNTRTGNTKH